MELENKSCRGMLIEVIVKSFIKDYALDSRDGLKEILQDKLNFNLNFETSITEVEEKNGLFFGGNYDKKFYEVDDGQTINSLIDEIFKTISIGINYFF